MRTFPVAVLVALAFVLAGCSGKSDEPAPSPSSSSTTSSASTSASSSATHSNSTSAHPSSSSSTSATASNTTSSSGTSTGPAGNGTGNATGGAPAPVSVTCTLDGGSNTFGGPTWTYSCTSDPLVSSTGAAFSSCHAKAEFDAPVPTTPAEGNTFEVTDSEGDSLGSAQGDSPLEFDLSPTPTGAQFALTGSVSSSIGPVVGGMGTVSGTVTFSCA